jgi:hypothetical protein
MVKLLLIMLVINAAILGAREVFVRNVAVMCVPMLVIVILGVAAMASPIWMDRKVALQWIESCLFCSAIYEFLLINIPVFFSPIQVVIPVFWMIGLHCPSVRKWRHGLSAGLQFGIGDFWVLNVAVATAATLWVALTKLWLNWPVAQFPRL